MGMSTARRQNVKVERKLQTVSKNGYYNTYVPNALAEENIFLNLPMEENELPAYEAVRSSLPKPFWQGNDSVIDCYWKAWELAFDHLRKPDANNGFVANYIDTAFNDCIFMWDTCFILMFAKYGHRVFSFQRTLDNFYVKQHPDGFICRQLSMTDGEDRFHRYDPTSTGPNVMAWSEWEYYGITGDTERLHDVFPVLAAYHRWLKAYRTWPDGTYWSSGWGAGMDNQPRMPAHMPHQADEFYHGHLAWIDTCLQQMLSAKLILQIANTVGREVEVQDLQEERDRLAALINERMWDDETAFYYDLKPDQEWLGMKSIGAYWALIADVVPQERIERFIAHLENPNEFNRPHRIPSLSADDPCYRPEGDYWRGGVWMPTNYMTLRGLTLHGYDALAHDIALTHVMNVAEVFEHTGTIWENYAPDRIERGDPSKPNFVGWSGLAPIAVLFEYVFGLRAAASGAKLVWDVRVLEEHGIERYPFGNEGLLDLKCAARTAATDKPDIQVSSNVPLTLVLRWEGGEEAVRVPASRE
ncbi:MGH1-like glycoside hydrolase domain-containing protein [Paenibacillus montanisoli]|nr:trehalase family glycosidase [Paenibacillus montanisoli]